MRHGKHATLNKLLAAPQVWTVNGPSVAMATCTCASPFLMEIFTDTSVDVDVGGGGDVVCGGAVDDREVAQSDVGAGAVCGSSDRVSLGNSVV